MESAFPHLREEGFSESSPASRKYNCIAWAAGVQDAWWWPDPFEVAFWPTSLPRVEKIDAFLQAFELLGFERCEDGDLEPGFEKVSFYILNGKPKHAARQLPDGTWTSKLGKGIDIIHTLRGLEGPAYGKVIAFMKRRLG